MGSKQANEINNNNKESKAESTGNDKGRARSIFLCDVEEEGFKEAKESTKKREIMERDGNQHSLKQRKEERATGTMRVNQRNPPPFSGRFISQRATKSESRGSTVILDPALNFKPQRNH